MKIVNESMSFSCEIDFTRYKYRQEADERINIKTFEFSHKHRERNFLFYRSQNSTQWQ